MQDRTSADASLQLLLDSFVAIASEQDAEAILEQAVDVARLSTQARFGAAVRVWDGEITHFVHKGLTRAQFDAMPHLPEGHGMLLAVLEDKTTTRLDVLQDDPRSVGFPLGHVPMAAFLGAPVMFEATVLGAIYLTKSPGEGSFSQQDELFIGVLARQTGVALKSAHLLGEQERVNEELRSLDRSKSDFMSMVSHELQTPLTSILGFSSTMLRYWDSIEEHEKIEYVETIERSTKRLSRLVSDLLAMSRIEAGTIAPRPEAVHLAEVFDRTIRDLDLTEEPVIVNCDDGLLAFVDADHVQQIAVNYVGNAVKYGSAPIHIDAARDGDAVVIRVRDSGEGVPESFVPHLFEKFAQAEKDTGRRKGVGLGLSIVKGLTVANGGDAWYEPGESGACFCVRLPSVA